MGLCPLPRPHATTVTTHHPLGALILTPSLRRDSLPLLPANSGDTTVALSLWRGLA